MYSTRDKILIALGGSPGKNLSGVQLAKRLGITRASVWKHVRVLKEDGFPIETRNLSGYRLRRPFDFSLLNRESLQDLDFWKAHYQFSTASTQMLAKSAADQGSPEGHLWLVEKQTAGRGRLDRRWESPLGGLWFSLILRPEIPPSAVPSLALVAALALAQAIHQETGVKARLKWPNDVVIQEGTEWRKISGLLTEMSAEVDRTRWVVLGVGVNVNNTLSNELKPSAATLEGLTGKLISRASLLRSFLRRFGKSYHRFPRGGFEGFRADYWKLYRSPGEEVCLKTSQGMVRGVARGVDARGALVVESGQQTKSFWEGEIVL